MLWGICRGGLNLLGSVHGWERGVLHGDLSLYGDGMGVVGNLGYDLYATAVGSGVCDVRVSVRGIGSSVVGG